MGGILLEPDEPEEPAGFDMGTPLLIEQAEAKKAAAEKEAEERAEADKNRDVSMLSNKESNYNDVEDENQAAGPEMTRDGMRLSNSYFHLVMTMASCYVAMLLTSWGTGATLSTTGETSMYVNIACEYVTALLFWWTLCAPKFFPERFGDGDDED